MGFRGHTEVGLGNDVAHFNSIWRQDENGASIAEFIDRNTPNATDEMESMRLSLKQFNVELFDGIFEFYEAFENTREMRRFDLFVSETFGADIKTLFNSPVNMIQDLWTFYLEHANAFYSDKFSMALVKDFNNACIAYLGRVIDFVDGVQLFTVEKLARGAEIVFKLNPHFVNYARKFQNALVFIDNVFKSVRNNAIDFLEDTIARTINPRVIAKVDFIGRQIGQFVNSYEAPTVVTELSDFIGEILDEISSSTSYRQTRRSVSKLFNYFRHVSCNYNLLIKG